jgi:hypothetical protein
VPDASGRCEGPDCGEGRASALYWLALAPRLWNLRLVRRLTFICDKINGIVTTHDGPVQLWEIGRHELPVCKFNKPFSSYISTCCQDGRRPSSERLKISIPDSTACVSRKTDFSSTEALRTNAAARLTPRRYARQKSLCETEPRRMRSLFSCYLGRHIWFLIKLEVCSTGSGGYRIFSSIRLRHLKYLPPRAFSTM